MTYPTEPTTGALLRQRMQRVDNGDLDEVLDRPTSMKLREPR